MVYRKIGTSEVEASVVAFGAWAIGGWMWGGTDRTEAIRALHAGFDSGVNFVDTAPVYGFGRSEEIVGEAIAGRRSRVVLATKVGLVWNTELGERFFVSDDPVDGKSYDVHRYLGPESVRAELEASLQRLKTDFIDLYQTHWQDSTTPIEDTMAELSKLKEEGKIRTIGVSNVTTGQIDRYLAAGTIEADQEQFSMLEPKPEETLLPYCAIHGLAFLAYSPLAQGLLTGKIRTDRTFAKGDQRRDNGQFSKDNRKRIAAMLEKFRPVADSHDCTFAQLAIAWTIHRRGCTHALVGARNEAQVRENAGGGSIDLTSEEIEIIDAAILEYRSK